MPFNGSGLYTAPGASFPAVTGETISSTKYNAVINDIATGLTTCITKDGQTTITSNTILTTNTSLVGDLIVEPGVVLTINPGVTLDIDFVNQKILIKFGGGILIKAGGTIA